MELAKFTIDFSCFHVFLSKWSWFSIIFVFSCLFRK